MSVEADPVATGADGADELLAVRGASYSYLDRFPALDDVSFRVRRGEKVALLGANGCGKSTLLKVLDGLVFPDRGTYHAFGAEVTERNLEDEQFSEGFRARVGFIFQNSDAQVFSPTVRDELAFGPLNMAMSRDEVDSRVDDTMQMLDIAHLADRAPYQLSGGQKKRVAIASVLVMNPEVLLFDEPTAALDPRTQQWLMELIVELNRAGKTIVLATHDLATLDTLADRCVVFSEDHRLVADGTPQDILTNRELLLSVNLIHHHSHVHRIDDPVSGVAREIVHSHDHDAQHHDDHDDHDDHATTGSDGATYAEVAWTVPATCAACERKIEAALRPLIGVQSVRVDVPAELVTIHYRADRTDLADLRRALADAGYPTGDSGKIIR